MSKELIKMKDRFDKIVHLQESGVIMSEYLKKEKWGITFSSSFISHCLLALIC